MITSFGNEMENMESEKNLQREATNLSTPLTTIHNHFVYVYCIHTLYALRYSHYAPCCKGDEEKEKKKKIDCFVHNEHRTQRLTDSTCWNGAN